MKKTEKCRVCGVKLIDFIAYIPNVGEACMDCYKKAAKKSESPEK